MPKRFSAINYRQNAEVTQPAFENKSRISPDAIKTFLASQKKSLIAICALLVGIWSRLCNRVCHYTSLTSLDKTISQNRLNDATGLAERLFVSRFGTLSGRDAEMYSEAFYRRAQVFAKNRNFKLALGDLTRVLPSYSRSAEVSQLKASYLLFLSQGKAAVGTNATTPVELNPTASVEPRTTKPVEPSTAAFQKKPVLFFNKINLQTSVFKP